MMGATVYGRRAIRRFERQTGEQIVHAAGPFVTTVDHRHLAWTGEHWTELEQDTHCGVSLSSCRALFGEVDHGVHRGFMRGPCGTCGVGCSMLHRADCAKLAGLLGWPSVNPDYWPRPVHRPMWMDDPRPLPRRTAYELAFTLDVPVEAMTVGTGRDLWAAREAEWAQTRAQANAALAAVAPDLLRRYGLDPDHYRIECE